ncbi:MAG TPA: DUF4332 domain-containing protein [Thiothrix sp.]|nr:DUF4332 domain-containing protein [Thiothrix sp.]
MSYLLSQIWICLLLTALVAGLAGWLLASGGKRKTKQLEDKWRTDLARAENERDYYAGEVKNLSAIAEEREEMEERFVAEKQSLENELDALQKGMKFSVDSSKQQEEKLTKKAHNLEEQNTSLTAKVEEEQQVFSQRIAELEASAELSKTQTEDYDQKILALQSELEEAHIKLADTTNRLTEAETNLDVAKSNLSVEPSNSGSSISSMASGIAAAGSAVVASSLLESDADDISDNESLIDVNEEDYSIDVIEAIEETDSKRLNKLGIKTTVELLQKASGKEEIALLAKSLGKESWVVRSWASVADLLRVQSVDAVDAELLELAGIATVQSLSRANVDKLVESTKVIHRHVGKTTAAPNAQSVAIWIQNAAKLEPMLETNVDKI